MVERKEILCRLEDEIRLGTKVITLWGESGLGKSVIISELYEKCKQKNDVTMGIIDLNQYTGMSNEVVRDALYHICDIVEKSEKIRLNQFYFLDEICCIKQGIIPYKYRRRDNAINKN